jgi:hypothetical protein
MLGCLSDRSSDLIKKDIVFLCICRVLPQEVISKLKARALFHSVSFTPFVTVNYFMPYKFLAIF